MWPIGLARIALPIWLATLALHPAGQRRPVDPVRIARPIWLEALGLRAVEPVRPSGLAQLVLCLAALWPVQPSGLAQLALSLAALGLIAGLSPNAQLRFFLLQLVRPIWLEALVLRAVAPGQPSGLARPALQFVPIFGLANQQLVFLVVDEPPALDALHRLAVSIQPCVWLQPPLGLLWPPNVLVQC